VGLPTLALAPSSDMRGGGSAQPDEWLARVNASAGSRPRCRNVLDCRHSRDQTRPPPGRPGIAHTCRSGRLTRRSGAGTMR
jgi:hypothetical protein